MLRDAALKPGKQRKPQPAAQKAAPDSVPSATQIPGETSAAASGDSMGSRQEPQPQPHSSYQVSGTLALVPSAPYRSLKVPVSVYVCVWLGAQVSRSMLWS